MTNKELSQLYYLKKEVGHLNNRITELECAATGTGAQITGMPHGYGASDKIAKYVVDIEELKEMLEKQLHQCIKEIKRLNNYIETIDDSQTRMIMSLRYVQGLTWTQIALKIGGGNTADGVKKRVYRYLIRG